MYQTSIIGIAKLDFSYFVSLKLTKIYGTKDVRTSVFAVFSEFLIT